MTELQQDMEQRLLNPRTNFEALVFIREIVSRVRSGRLSPTEAIDRIDMVILHKFSSRSK